MRDLAISLESISLAIQEVKEEFKKMTSTPTYDISSPQMSDSEIAVMHLIELKKIITEYSIGGIIKNHSPQEISKSLVAMWENEKRFLEFRKNTKIAAKELNWEKEVIKLLDVYRDL